MALRRARLDLRLGQRRDGREKQRAYERDHQARARETRHRQAFELGLLGRKRRFAVEIGPALAQSLETLDPGSATAHDGPGARPLRLEALDVLAGEEPTHAASPHGLGTQGDQRTLGAPNRFFLEQTPTFDQPALGLGGRSGQATRLGLHLDQRDPGPLEFEAADPEHTFESECEALHGLPPRSRLRSFATESDSEVTSPRG